MALVRFGGESNRIVAPAPTRRADALLAPLGHQILGLISHVAQAAVHVSCDMNEWLCLWLRSSAALCLGRLRTSLAFSLNLEKERVRLEFYSLMSLTKHELDPLCSLHDGTST